MTPSQRRRLIEKRQQGTLTDEENLKYQELLRDDSSFNNDVDMHNMLTDVFRQNADQDLWAAVSKARTKSRTAVIPATRRYYTYAYAIAACVALLLVGIFWPPGQSDGPPQLVKSEKRGVRLLIDSSSVGYDDFAGSVWIQWKQNQQQKVPQAYTFCRDTLTVFLKNPQDTVLWRAVGLRFSSEQQILYVDRTNKPLLPLLECTNIPQTLSLSP